MRNFLFVWFVVSVIVVALVSVAGVVWTGPYFLLATWSFYGADLVEYAAQNELQAFETGGIPALDAFEKRVSPDGRVHSYLFDPEFKEVRGRNPPKKLLDFAHQLNDDSPLRFERDGRGMLAGNAVRDIHGNLYRVLISFSFHRASLPVNESGWIWGWILRISAMLAIAALLCSWLAWRLSTPLERLRQATRKFASGDLAARAGAAFFPKHPPEYAELARDFDEMADRIEGLIGSQRQLLRDVSHELRTPLTRLGLAVNIARRETGSAALESLDRIDQESERLNALIERIIRLSRMEATAEKPRRDPIEMSDFIDSIVSDANFEAEPLGRKVKILRCDPCRLNGDREMLREAVENVIRNAIRFAPEGTSVAVDAFLDGSSYFVQVGDEGPGVAADHLAGIFDPFYRAPQGDDGGKGFGLGLAIARRAVQLHGGTIAARNLTPGFQVEILLPNQHL